MAFRNVSLFLASVILLTSFMEITTAKKPCYDERNNPTRCFPRFVNAAYRLPVTVTNTCGVDKRENFCLQTGISGNTKSCDVCDAHDPKKAHNSIFLTDQDGHENVTWWQSSTMNEDIQYPASVNLTLNFGKSFEINYIKLKFHSSRPESFAIYKRTYGKGPWIPFQYFSSTCEDTYGLSSLNFIIKEDQATCRDDFSDISPLTGGSVAFSTLEGRPNLYSYQDSKTLQEWVTATDIMVSLNRINTFRDEVFGDEHVLSSYFYAISDFAVGGRCMCHGHANDCFMDGGRLKCRCEHYTDGTDCEKCRPFYNDQPWKSGMGAEVQECKPCNCNGLSETCEFDYELYQKTGHGGRCTNCRENTSGPNCNLCQDEFYHSRENNKCVPCNCHHLGSEYMQCDDHGQCRCRPGVIGEKCDRCQPYYFNLTIEGCTRCQCYEAGILPGSEQTCDFVTGKCRCREFVTGRDCDTCKEGYFGLTFNNPLGCTSCFCYGHSTVCSLQSGYVIGKIESQFKSDSEGWAGLSQLGDETDVEHLDISQEISIVSNDDQPQYFIAPTAYLGDQHHSHNLHLSFDLRLDGGVGPVQPSINDVVIVSGHGISLTIPIFGQDNPVPSREKQRFKFFLSEHPFFQWNPQRLSNVEFGKFLSNITMVKIRGTYAPQGIGYLSNVVLETIVPGRNGNDHNSVAVEMCTCPKGYVGQFCESCAPGFRRFPANGGPFGTCVPCECNGHSEVCHSESGQCICGHNTVGLNCQNCANGYYGDAVKGTPYDCKPCNCPRDGRCTEMAFTGDICCLDCDEGYGGLRCDHCIDGYYKNYEKKCVACDCNNNTDPNAVGTCDVETGECRKCLYNTTGSHCQDCQKGFFGVAVQEPHGECHACDCYSIGTLPEDDEDEYHRQVSGCDLWTGQCHCRENVIGLKCDACLDGTWNLHSGNGCHYCNCDVIGSFNSSCDPWSGQCFCKPGMTGLQCHQCLPEHFGFSHDGCQECKCNPYGSLNNECDIMTGQCQCRQKFVGRSCDQCDINMYDLRAGCVECPICYNIVREAADEVKMKIKKMQEIVDQAENLPTNYAEDDEEFKRRLAIQSHEVQLLWSNLKNNDRWNDLNWARNSSEIIDVIKASLNSSMYLMKPIEQKVMHIEMDLHTVENSIENANGSLKQAKEMLDNEGQKLLAEVREEQEKSGQQSENMTHMAKESRDAVIKLEQQVENAVNFSEEALKLSQKATEISQELLQKKYEQEKQMESLFNVNRLAQQRFKMVKEESNNSVKLSNNAQNRSNEVDDLQLPEFETENFDNNKTTSVVKAMKDELVNNSILLDKSEQHLLEIERNLTSSLNQGDVAIHVRMELSKMAESIYNDSLEAQTKANEVSVAANDLLLKFKSFDENMARNKEEAEKAKEKFAEIDKSIKDGENFTNVAVYQLSKVDLKAQTEHDLVMFNIINAYNMSQDLDELIKSSGEIHVESIDIDENVTLAHESISKFEEKFEKLDVNYIMEKEKIETVVAITSNNSIAVNELLRSYHELNTEITRLFNAMDNLEVPLPDEIGLGVIEAKLDELDAALGSMELESKYNEFAKHRELRKNWVEDYGNEIRQLEADVDNLQQISLAIPKTCFKEVTLEPIG